LLWEYAHDQASFDEIQRGTALVVRNIQAFRRAEREEKRHLDDTRAHMFRRRRQEAARILTQTPWPFRNPAMQTFGDVARVYRSPELFDLRKIRALVERSGLNNMLVILRVGAMAYGVCLSGNELAALAYCASGKELDGSAVRRLLREPWIAAAEPGFRTVFETFLASAK
jgi:excisionase family DNA binding protein